ncbi:MAG: hypothetical protein QF807_03375 [Candidatus Thalassarchaeaceae archaeon]|nr:hypothetical protein [Candidatus Thalassarchaeaceae archaeon]MDP7043038.1 hypothetical protein [Candidatus Thalassarchaeaceae archaeon]
MDAWLEEWLGFHSKRLRDSEEKKSRLKRVARNLLSTRFWKGRN